MKGPYDPSVSATRETHKLIGVVTPVAARERASLLEALEQVLPVTFHARVPTELEGLDGLLVLSDEESSVSLGAISPEACPILRIHHARAGANSEGHVVKFTEDPSVARPLRGRLLREEGAGVVCSEQPSDGDAILATVDDVPVWWSSQGGRVHFSAFAPQELGERESLREHLRPGRFMGLLALLHFLRGICGESYDEERPLMAAFVIDDPNVHRTSYGYIDYADLATQATRHGYHAAFATVPLDGWVASRRALRLLRDNPSSISLLMHGNDHTTEELGRLTDEPRAQASLAQALRRVSSFESRYGLPVERVMVPPHEVCAQMALGTMFRLGFEAACIGRGHPWINSQSTSPLSWPLVKWFPTDLVCGGFPIIPRHPLDRPWEDLVFRALLGQPLIMFAHHEDFAQGLDVLARAAEYINDLGSVQWASLSSIARQGYTVERQQDKLVIRMYARCVRVEVPHDVSSVEVRTPCMSLDELPRSLYCDGVRVSMASTGMGRDGWRSDSLRVSPGSALKLVTAPERTLDPYKVAVDARRPWPLMRRALVEGRDRLEPLSSRLGLGR